MAALLWILQYLFRCDHILYTIVAVSGKESLEKSFSENSEGVSIISSDIADREAYLVCSQISVIKYQLCYGFISCLNKYVMLLSWG